MESFSRRRMMKKFSKACSKDMVRIRSIVSGMHFLFWQEGINNDFSTYNAFLELLRQITEITNNVTRSCTIDKIDFKQSAIIDRFITNLGSISYLDCNADFQSISIEDAKALVPMPDSVMVLNPAIGLTSDGYCAHLAVHTSLMSTYNTCIDFFQNIYNLNEGAG